VIDVADGNTDLAGMRAAIAEGKACTDKPTMIVCHTLIGYGSPNKVNSYAAHGSPLGADETALTRTELGWKYGEFEVPEEVYPAMRDARIKAGAELEAAWQKGFEEYKGKYPEEAAEFEAIRTGELPANWADCLPKSSSADKGLATRAHSQTMLNAIAPVIPGFLGGSADLAGSNLTLMKMFGDFQKDSYAERNLRFGVREHGMGAIGNGAHSLPLSMPPLSLSPPWCDVHPLAPASVPSGGMTITCKKVAHCHLNGTLRDEAVHCLKCKYCTCIHTLPPDWSACPTLLWISWTQASRRTLLASSPTPPPSSSSPTTCAPPCALQRSQRCNTSS
jgi:hypothetical protein